MKRFLSFICIIVLMFVLVGCNESGADIAKVEDYTIDKEVVIKEELTYEEALQKVSDLEEQEANYFSYDAKVSAEGMTTSIKLALADENDVYNGTMTMSVDMGDVKVDIEMFIKDSYIYVDFPGLGKVKTKIPGEEELEDFMGSNKEGYEEFLAEFYAIADGHADKVKAGFDSNGCLVLDYNYEGAKGRFVFDKGYPIYFYIDAEISMEMKFSYEKVTIEFPEDLKPEDYEEINWDEFEGMGLM